MTKNVSERVNVATATSKEPLKKFSSINRLDTTDLTDEVTLNDVFGELGKLGLLHSIHLNYYVKDAPFASVLWTASEVDEVYDLRVEDNCLYAVTLIYENGVVNIMKGISTVHVALFDEDDKDYHHYDFNDFVQMVIVDIFNEKNYCLTF